MAYINGSMFSYRSSSHGETAYEAKMGAAENAILQEQLDTRYTGTIVVESFVMCLILCVSLVGNLLVLLAVWRNHRLRTISNMFVVNLAISDTSMATLCMPFAFGTLIQSKWIFGDEYCQAQGLFTFCLGLASLNTMFFIAVNRYFCIVKPAKYQRHFSRRKTIIYVFIIWFNSFGGSIPPLFFKYGGYDFQPGKAMCLYKFEANIPYTVCLEVLFIGIPLNIIAFCYFSVFRTVRRNNKVFAASSNNQAELRARVKETKVTKTLAAVFMGYATCWIPVSIIDYLDAINGAPIYKRQVYLLYSFLIYISSLINPVIYGLASRSFRREYVVMLKGIICLRGCKSVSPENMLSNTDETHVKYIK